MELVCEVLNACDPCCTHQCKWVTFENRTESCQPTVENLENVVKMIEKSENCPRAPEVPEDLIKGDSNLFCVKSVVVLVNAKLL